MLDRHAHEVTASVSANGREALCGSSFPQVAAEVVPDVRAGQVDGLLLVACDGK
jgi:hypothetical protein